jgi:predicted TIM-barrel fold metal-dependent hydrolase
MSGAIDLLFHSARVPMPSPAMSCGQALALLDAAGVERAFVSHCNQWGCERQPLCLEVRLEYVLRFTRHSPRFLGLAGYNPFDIPESLREIEAALTLGFRGIFLHTPSFGLPLNDAKLYPLFATAAELRTPVLVELALAEPDLVATVRRVAKDIPELTLVLLQPRPDAALMQLLAADCENLAFALDARGLAHLSGTGLRPVGGSFFDSTAFGERCCYASNGPAPATAMAAARALPVAPDVLARFLGGNAARLFRLDQAAEPRTPKSLAAETLVAET